MLAIYFTDLNLLYFLPKVFSYVLKKSEEWQQLTEACANCCFSWDAVHTPTVHFGVRLQSFFERTVRKHTSGMGMRPFAPSGPNFFFFWAEDSVLLNHCVKCKSDIRNLSEIQKGSKNLRLFLKIWIATLKYKENKGMPLFSGNLELHFANFSQTESSFICIVGQVEYAFL